MFEYKRVGKEGDSKGPQTIEKAKQGAYVSRTISSIQRIKDNNGNLLGFLDYNNKYIIDDYYKLIDRVINGDLHNKIKNFCLSVGIVSNHGNWFTKENKNKELEVLCQSYDWLLFLTDDGLVEFIENMLSHPSCMQAFNYSYSINQQTKKKNMNIYTKSSISSEADKYLSEYFINNIDKIENWFNILSPNGDLSLSLLKNQLLKLGE